MHTYLYMHVQEMKYIFYEYDCVEIFWEQIVMSSSTNSRYSKSVIVYGWWLYWCTCMSTVTPISRPTGLFVWRVRALACMRMRQHTCKPIGGCYLSHAWKVIFSWKRLVHRIFFFQSFVFVYERHLWIMQYMSIAYRRCANHTCKIVHTCNLQHACCFAHEKDWTNALPTELQKPLLWAWVRVLFLYIYRW